MFFPDPSAIILLFFPSVLAYPFIKLVLSGSSASELLNTVPFHYLLDGKCLFWSLTFRFFCELSVRSNGLSYFTLWIQKTIRFCFSPQYKDTFFARLQLCFIFWRFSKKLDALLNRRGIHNSWSHGLWSILQYFFDRWSDGTSY